MFELKKLDKLVDKVADCTNLKAAYVETRKVFCIQTIQVIIYYLLL